MSTQSFKADGLTCDHCVSAVTEELTSVVGVRGVSVELVPGGASTVHVESERTLSDVEITTALDEAGDYHLVSG